MIADRDSSGRFFSPLPLEPRFWSKVDKSRICLCDYCLNHTGYCWQWIAYINKKGYGMFKIHGRVVEAYRVAYEFTKGNVPSGLELDHLCRQRWCVNPDHLEPVTRKENVHRGIGPTAKKFRQTRCLRGHPLSGDNLYVYPNGQRCCRICHKLAHFLHSGGKG